MENNTKEALTPIETGMNIGIDTAIAAIRKAYFLGPEELIKILEGLKKS